MIFKLNQKVKYRKVIGTIAFIADQYISVLVVEGKHRSQDVRVVIYKSQQREIEILE